MRVTTSQTGLNANVVAQDPNTLEEGGTYGTQTSDGSNPDTDESM